MHASMTQSLLIRMSTITEAIELARATGLTAGQALYNAQMIRTHSLLLRTAQRQGYIIGGRQVNRRNASLRQKLAKNMRLLGSI